MTKEYDAFGNLKTETDVILDYETAYLEEKDKVKELEKELKDLKEDIVVDVSCIEKIDINILNNEVVKCRNKSICKFVTKPQQKLKARDDEIKKIKAILERECKDSSLSTLEQLRLCKIENKVLKKKIEELKEKNKKLKRFSDMASQYG